MTKRNKKFEKINFIFNIFFIILISLSLINEYAVIALISTIIYGSLTLWIKKLPFYSLLEWPGFEMRLITSFIVSVLLVTYIRFIGNEYISIYIRYIVFISVLIIYISMYIKETKNRAS